MKGAAIVLAVFGFGILLMKRETKIMPRGIRNNNPLNIRWDGVTAWQGLAGVDPEGFAIFETPEHGIRAAARILKTYNSRGVKTLGEIVYSWAPPSENETPAYIHHVMTVMGMGIWETVEPYHYPDLLAVMIKHENGQQPYSAETIAQGVAMA